MAVLQQTTLDALKRTEAQLATSWRSDLEASGAIRNLKAEDIDQQTREFLRLLNSVLEKGASQSISASEWEEARQFLEKLSHQRALAGQDSQQTANFIFALKGPLFGLLQQVYADQPTALR